MVYESFLAMQPSDIIYPNNPEQGYLISEGKADNTYPEYTIFTDDGKGNGSVVCVTGDLYWARRIAHGLDNQEHTSFDLNGNIK